MESSYLCNNFTRRGSPYENSYKFSTLIVCFIIISSWFSCHLTSGNNISVRMNRHRYYIFFMKIEELLSHFSRILNNTETGSCETYLTLACVLQIPSKIKTAETMSPLKFEICIWCFCSICSWFPTARS
jgi:hypothetical protein